jgi:hypothetical protein
LLAAGVAHPAVSFAQQSDANLTAPLNTLNDAQKTYAGVSGMVSEMHQYGLASRSKAAQALAQLRSGVLAVHSSDKVPQDLLHSTLLAIDEAQTALTTDSAQTIAWSLQTVGLEVQDLQAKLTGQKPPAETASQERPTGGGGTRAPDQTSQSSAAKETPEQRNAIVAEAEHQTGVVRPQTPQEPNSNVEQRVRDERGQSGPMQQAAPEKPMDRTAQAPAQPAQQPGSQKQADTAAIQPAQLTALANMKRDDIVGKWLADKNGNDIARIADLKTSADGKIQAAEIDLGGFLGIGSRRVAVPVDELQLKGDRIEAKSMTADQIRNLEAR